MIVVSYHVTDGSLVITASLFNSGALSPSITVTSPLSEIMELQDSLVLRLLDR